MFDWFSIFFQKRFFLLFPASRVWTLLLDRGDLASAGFFLNPEGLSHLAAGQLNSGILTVLSCAHTPRWDLSASPTAVGLVGCTWLLVVLAGII